jgi:hypothetical protein
MKPDFKSNVECSKFQCEIRLIKYVFNMIYIFKHRPSLVIRVYILEMFLKDPSRDTR